MQIKRKIFREKTNLQSSKTNDKRKNKYANQTKQKKEKKK